MVERAEDRRFESGSIRGFADADADLALTHLRVAFRGELVGTLALTEDGVLAFQYADSWIEGGFSISPFSLPLERKVFVADPHPLGGVSQSARNAARRRGDREGARKLGRGASSMLC